MDGATHILKGTFTGTGYTGTSKPSISMNLALSGSGANAIVTGLANGVGLIAYRAAYAKGVTLDETGKYTLLLSNTDTAPVIRKAPAMRQ